MYTLSHQIIPPLIHDNKSIGTFTLEFAFKLDNSHSSDGDDDDGRDDGMDTEGIREEVWEDEVIYYFELYAVTNHGPIRLPDPIPFNPSSFTTTTKAGIPNNGGGESSSRPTDETRREIYNNRRPKVCSAAIFITLPNHSCSIMDVKVVIVPFEGVRDEDNKHNINKKMVVSELPNTGKLEGHEYDGEVVNGIDSSNSSAGATLAPSSSSSISSSFLSPSFLQITQVPELERDVMILTSTLPSLTPDTNPTNSRSHSKPRSNSPGSSKPNYSNPNSKAPSRKLLKEDLERRKQARLRIIRRFEEGLQSKGLESVDVDGLKKKKSNPNTDPKNKPQQQPRPPPPRPHFLGLFTIMDIDHDTDWVEVDEGIGTGARTGVGVGIGGRGTSPATGSNGSGNRGGKRSRSRNANTLGTTTTTTTTTTTIGSHTPSSFTPPPTTFNPLRGSYQAGYGYFARSMYNGKMVGFRNDDGQGGWFDRLLTSMKLVPHKGRLIIVVERVNNNRSQARSHRGGGGGNAGGETINSKPKSPPLVHPHPHPYPPTNRLTITFTRTVETRVDSLNPPSLFLGGSSSNITGIGTPALETIGDSTISLNALNSSNTSSSAVDRNHHHHPRIGSRSHPCTGSSRPPTPNNKDNNNNNPSPSSSFKFPPTQSPSPSPSLPTPSPHPSQTSTTSFSTSTSWSKTPIKEKGKGREKRSNSSPPRTSESTTTAAAATSTDTPNQYLQPPITIAIPKDGKQPKARAQNQNRDRASTLKERSHSPYSSTSLSNVVGSGSGVDIDANSHVKTKSQLHPHFHSHSELSSFNSPSEFSEKSLIRNISLGPDPDPGRGVERPFTASPSPSPSPPSSSLSSPSLSSIQLRNADDEDEDEDKDKTHQNNNNNNSTTSTSSSKPVPSSISFSQIALGQITSTSKNSNSNPKGSFRSSSPSPTVQIEQRQQQQEIKLLPDGYGSVSGVVNGVDSDSDSRIHRRRCHRWDFEYESELGLGLGHVHSRGDSTASSPELGTTRVSALTLTLPLASASPSPSTLTSNSTTSPGPHTFVDPKSEFNLPGSNTVTGFGTNLSFSGKGKAKPFISHSPSLSVPVYGSNSGGGTSGLNLGWKSTEALTTGSSNLVDPRPEAGAGAGGLRPPPTPQGRKSKSTTPSVVPSSPNPFRQPISIIPGLSSSSSSLPLSLSSSPRSRSKCRCRSRSKSRSRGTTPNSRSVTPTPNTISNTTTTAGTHPNSKNNIPKFPIPDLFPQLLSHSPSLLPNNNNNDDDKDNDDYSHSYSHLNRYDYDYAYVTTTATKARADQVVPFDISEPSSTSIRVDYDWDSHDEIVWEPWIPLSYEVGMVIDDGPGQGNEGRSRSRSNRGGIGGMDDRNDDPSSLSSSYPKGLGERLGSSSGSNFGVGGSVGGSGGKARPAREVEREKAIWLEMRDRELREKERRKLERREKKKEKKDKNDNDSGSAGNMIEKMIKGKGIKMRSKSVDQIDQRRDREGMISPSEEVLPPLGQRSWEVGWDIVITQSEPVVSASTNVEKRGVKGDSKTNTSGKERIGGTQNSHGHGSDLEAPDRPWERLELASLKRRNSSSGLEDGDQNEGEGMMEEMEDRLARARTGTNYTINGRDGSGGSGQIGLGLGLGPSPFFFDSRTGNNKNIIPQSLGMLGHRRLSRSDPELGTMHVNRPRGGGANNSLDLERGEDGRITPLSIPTTRMMMPFGAQLGGGGVDRALTPSSRSKRRGMMMMQSGNESFLREGTGTPEEEEGTESGSVGSTSSVIVDPDADTTRPGTAAGPERSSDPSSGTGTGSGSAVGGFSAWKSKRAIRTKGSIANLIGIATSGRKKTG